MRKIFMHAGTGYGGSDMNQIVEVPEDITDKELDEWAWQEAIQNAESYGFEAHEDACECEECVENNGSVYSLEQVEYHWEEYNPEKHDDLV